MQKINWIQKISPIIIGLLIIEVVWLTIQNRELKSTIENTGKSPYGETLQSGERVEPFSVYTSGGDKTELTYSDSSKKNLFFVLSTNCPHCVRNLDKWEILVKRFVRTEVNIFGLSLDSL